MADMTPPPGKARVSVALSSQDQARWDLRVLAIGALIVILDQITKALITAHFSGSHLYDIVPVIDHIIVFEYDRNTGAAFSSFTHSPLLLTFLILIALGVIGWLYWSTRPRANPWLKITFGLILGGAVGNLIDRFRLGYVVDFVHFQIPALGFSFAVFNVADSGISIGIVALAVIFWLMPRQEPIPEAAPYPVPEAQVHPAPLRRGDGSASAALGNSSAARPHTSTHPIATKAAATQRAAKPEGNGKASASKPTTARTAAAKIRATASASRPYARSAAKKRKRH